LFLALVPVTTYITKENGIVQKLVETLVGAVPGATMDRAIPALGAFYVFVTFAASGAASAGGLGASRKEGLDNNREWLLQSAPIKPNKVPHQTLGNSLET